MLKGQFQKGGSTNYESNPELGVDLTRDGKRLKNSGLELVQELSSCTATVKNTNPNANIHRGNKQHKEVHGLTILFALELLHIFSECEYTFTRKSNSNTAIDRKSKGSVFFPFSDPYFSITNSSEAASHN